MHSKSAVIAPAPRVTTASQSAVPEVKGRNGVATTPAELNDRQSGRHLLGEDRGPVVTRGCHADSVGRMASNWKIVLVARTLHCRQPTQATGRWSSAGTRFPTIASNRLIACSVQNWRRSNLRWRRKSAASADVETDSAMIRSPQDRVRIV
jgi:hypothetical protein